MFDINFYKSKRVFVTGHTGFKGSWLCTMLLGAGAEVTGYANLPPTNPSLFELCALKNKMHSVIGDIRDLKRLQEAFTEAKPEIVFHLAAQPLVRESYAEPRYTYETNVMGTVNILECIRQYGAVKSFLNVTTDKVYRNNEWEWGYRETDLLDGFDPYSNSKSCSDLITFSYQRSFFKSFPTAVSTARAGNVIGGGDFSDDRIIPDCVRAVQNKGDILVRNPNSTRPYQHVIEPLYAYLMIASVQYGNRKFAGCYNVGPDESDCVTTGELVDLFCKAWGDDVAWQNVSQENAPHEANFLKLDCSKIKVTLGWKPRWDIDDAVEKTVEWSKIYLAGGDINQIMESQIKEYLKEIK